MNDPARVARPGIQIGDLKRAAANGVQGLSQLIEQYEIELVSPYHDQELRLIAILTLENQSLQERLTKVERANRALQIKVDALNKGMAAFKQAIEGV